MYPDLLVTYDDYEGCRNTLTGILCDLKDHTRQFTALGSYVGHADLQQRLEHFAESWQIRRGWTIDLLHEIRNEIAEQCQAWVDFDKNSCLANRPMENNQHTTNQDQKDQGNPSTNNQQGPSNSNPAIPPPNSPAVTPPKLKEKDRIGPKRLPGEEPPEMRPRKAKKEADTSQEKDDATATAPMEVSGGNTGTGVGESNPINPWAPKPLGTVSLPQTDAEETADGTYKAFEQPVSSPPVATGALGAIFNYLQRQVAVEAAAEASTPAVELSLADRINLELSAMGITAEEVTVKADPMDPNAIVAYLQTGDGSVLQVELSKAAADTENLFTADVSTTPVSLTDSLASDLQSDDLAFRDAVTEREMMIEREAAIAREALAASEPDLATTSSSLSGSGGGGGLGGGSLGSGGLFADDSSLIDPDSSFSGSDLFGTTSVTTSTTPSHDAWGLQSQVTDSDSLSSSSAGMAGMGMGMMGGAMGMRGGSSGQDGKGVRNRNRRLLDEAGKEGE
ncbi:MAG: hypothetical protein LBR20_07465 [Propionibacteriaceae bacterium]|nr:hypothetical protein [Propionibacteriaceae bacterium]